MQAKVYVTLKKGVHDPQGEAVHKALGSMGYKGIGGVRIGKFIEVKLGEMTKENAASVIDEVCSKLFANTVIETYKYEIED